MESVWYYARGGAQTGPVSFGDLKTAAASGQLGAEDLVWREGTAEWVPARTVAGLFPAPAAPPAAIPNPPPPPRMPAPAVLPGRTSRREALESLPLADEATPAPPPVGPGGPRNEMLDLAKLFLQRTVAANPATIAPTPEEQTRLTQAGYDETARRYLVWRRAVLWVAVVPTAFAAFFRLITLLDMEKEEKALLSPFGTLLLFLQAFSLCALPIAAAFGALSYDRLAKSARTVLIGGLISLGVPLLIAFLPASWFFDMKTTSETTVGEVEGQRMLFGIFLGVQFYLLLMPMVLSLLPAISRGCVRIKGFLPESLVPGWGLVASVPVFVLLTLATFIVVYHVASNILLLIGLLLWIGAPLIYLTNFRLLTRPVIDSKDLAALAKTQIYVLATLGMAILLIVIYMFSAKFGGKTLLGTSKDAVWRIWSLDIQKTWIEYVGRSLFLTVMFADLLVRIAVLVWREERAFVGSAAAANYDHTMSALGEVIETKPTPPVA
jgi:hypothetical protein